MPWINGEEVPDPPVWEDRADVRESMDRWQRKHWDEAEYEAAQPTYMEPKTTLEYIGPCPSVILVPSGLKCTHWEQPYTTWPFIQCTNGAGEGTGHEGVGLCYKHKGNDGRGKVQGAILMAHAYAQELDVTPWQALLSQVRLLANQVEWLRLRVIEAENIRGAAAIRPGGSDFDWVLMLEARGERLAKVSKMAIDAGVAERLVKQIELEAESMFRAALAGLDAAGIQGPTREKMLEGMAGKLLEIEAEHRTV